MKRLLTIVLAVSCIMQLQLASAQTAEVQQLVLNIEKLAQLKQILSDMKKGYDIVSKGYNRVKDISEGNFNIHQVFLDGLLAVNPELRKYRRVADIIAFQVSILNEYKSAFNRFRSGGHFSAEELDYMAKVYSNLFDRSLQNIDELTMILTSGELRMSDDNRLKAIDRLYQEMQEKLSFLRKFNRKTAGLEKQRENLLRESESLRKMYGTDRP